MFAVVYECGETPKFFETELSQDDFMTFQRALYAYYETLLFNERPYFFTSECDIETLTYEDAEKVIEAQKRREYVKEHNKKIDDEIRLITANLPVKSVVLSAFSDQAVMHLLKEEGYKEAGRTIAGVTLVKHLDGYQEAYDKVKDQIVALEKQRVKK